MKLVTKRSTIEGVADRWEKQYQSYLKAGDDRYGDKRAVLDRLRKLDLSSCPEDDVIDAIGNNSWTLVDCQGCGGDHDRVVIMSYESDAGYPIQFCIACLDEAIETLSGGCVERCSEE